MLTFKEKFDAWIAKISNATPQPERLLHCADCSCDIKLAGVFVKDDPARIPSVTKNGNTWCTNCARTYKELPVIGKIEHTQSVTNSMLKKSGLIVDDIIDQPEPIKPISIPKVI